MTNDFTELASAYLDGEATPEEIVLVESSDECLLLVEQMRQLSGQLPSITPDPEQKENHIAAALAAFAEPDESSATKSPQSENVIPLATSQKKHNQPSSKSDSSQPNTSKPRNSKVKRTSFPWLQAAAGIVVVGGGFTFAATQFADSNSTTVSDEGSAEFTSSDKKDDKKDSKQASPLSGRSDDDKGSARDDKKDSAKDTDRAKGDDALDRPEEASPQMQDSPDADHSEQDAEPLRFAQVPSTQKLQELATSTNLSTNYEESACAVVIPPPDGAQLFGFTKIMVANEPAEMIVFSQTGTVEGRLTVEVANLDCELLT